MTEQAQNSGPSALDAVKLVAGAAILVGGIAAFYVLDSYPLAVRWVIVLATFAAGVFVALQSMQGQAFWQFVQGSRVELRKMVWPTRQETWRTTLVVFVFVMALGVFFWIVDWVLAKGMRFVTGQGA